MRMSSCVLVLLALVLSGVSEILACQATEGKTAIQNLNNGSVTAAVKGKLAVDNILNLHTSLTRVDVDADSEQGTVFLSGEVQTSEQKARAEQLAGQVDGVKRVTNNIQVRPSKRR
jgi:hyperosmotically inducible protein